MAKSTSSRQQAAECRASAQQMGLREQRNRLLEMAQEWEALAAEREAALQAGTELLARGQEKLGREKPRTA